MNNKFIKKGDKIKIRSLDWYNEFKDNNGYVGQFVHEMTEYCGKEAVIVKVLDNINYELDIDNGSWNWQDYMFEPNSIILNFIEKRFCKSCENKNICCDFCLFKGNNNLYNIDIGDKVKVRSSEWFSVNDIMHGGSDSHCDQRLYENSVSIVTSILESSTGYHYYTLDVSNDIMWPDYMFDLQSQYEKLLNKYCEHYCIHFNNRIRCKECLLSKYNK